MLDVESGGAHGKDETQYAQAMHAFKIPYPCSNLAVEEICDMSLIGCTLAVLSSRSRP